ncbi:glycogen debranching enzyme N-terminal domain-containing protein [Prevotella aurantiaca]|jgi:putative glycogen debranching enzyme|uniref:Glycogen debranching enzyme N-terminal domain-containing protein n=1 Tax=Prevotella aurantiaca TaxID=596085 RepID=A0A930MXE5_9BACT|nr:glycogen debranching enzyme N-terminal domain-containing protein [Prevotella aurantiaca]MBF1384309.1 glycogen debranching enzyme N-terminal domain-containing protein [Prevotella aurantiaca]
MGYLKFEKALMTNLQDSLPRELLRTNRSGAYSCSTIVDCNTRKYHGLFVVPVPGLDDENHVLLSSLDPTVIQHGAAFNLGLHKYHGGNYSPNGHKYIREFDCDKVPTTIYKVGNAVLKKEVVLQCYEERILVRYTLLEGQGTTLLQFRPFLAFRSVREFTHENAAINREYHNVENGIATCLYEGYPQLFMQFSKDNEFHYEPYWYRGLEYPKEEDRGYHSDEDLYVPGYFEMKIRKGESIVFSGSTSEIKTSKLKRLFDNEVEIRQPRDNFFHCLVNAAHQFHNRKKNGDRYILAGYPWFKCRARDQFISLPGLTLNIEEQDYFELVMKTAQRGLREFMKNDPLTVEMQDIDQPDVMLWCIWALQQYAKEAGKESCLKLYGDFLREMMTYIENGKHPNLFLHANGLLYAEGKDRAITWMDGMLDGKPVNPRSGYIVEFNALWYNNLKFVAWLFSDTSDTEYASHLEQMAEECKTAFIDTFMNNYGYLYDYVDGNMVDWSVRPNMILAAALDYSPLDQSQKKSVIDICTRELLTPKGLRSLSPKSGGYNPICTGDRDYRTRMYHQGTAWPWLGGFYLEACLKLYKRTRLSYVERQLIGYEDEVLNHCLGTIPEYFDGNPPYHGRGAISFAMNVGAVLRTLALLEKYKY